MKNKLVWYDTMQVKARTSDDGLNFVEDVLTDSAGEAYLETKVRATHSGHLITGRCYSGWGVRDGAPSWYSKDRGGSAGFDKPVILNHDLKSEPLGRVVDAKFHQLKYGLEWKDDWREPDSGPGSYGSGFIVNTAHIYDEDAIKKIVDGRYNTVSTRQSPASLKDVWCSICGKNFASGCDHRIGDYYEVSDDADALCYVVTGLLDYVEMSYVLNPRQPNAVTLSFNEIRDSLSEAEDQGDLLLQDCHLDFTTEMDLFIRNNENIVDLSDEKFPSTTCITDKAFVSMTKKINGAAPGIELEGLDETAIGDDEDCCDISEAIVNVLDSMKEAGLIEPACLDDGSWSYELEGQTVTISHEDAKLSAEERKKLPDSAFCGPDRSFPAHDCAHVRAGFRLLSRSNKGNKDDIKACLQRKNKSMSCGVKSGDSADSECAPCEAPDPVFASLASLWKDHLDLETDFTDSHYVMGITNKAAGHAHLFDAFLDSKNKVLKGDTRVTGQGKAKHGHGHSIWVEDVDMNDTDVSGETRDASAGDSHTHTFTASMIDGEDTYATLIATVDSVKNAIEYLDQRENTDTHGSEWKDSVLTDESVITWDQETVRAALPLLGRLNPDKRQEVLADIAKSILSDDGPIEEEVDMTDTLQRMLKTLMDEKDELKGKLAEATKLADSKESERQALLTKNKELSASNLKLKASLIVDAQSRLAEEAFTDKQKQSKIAELVGKDEEHLDELLDSEVLSKIVKPSVEEPSSEDSEDSEKEDKKDLFSKSPETVIDEGRDPDELADNKPVGDSKNLLNLDRISAIHWGN